MKTKDDQWSGSFFKWGTGQDSSRKVSEAGKHLKVTFIGDYWMKDYLQILAFKGWKM